MTEDVTMRVRRGARLLDAYFPRWEAKITGQEISFTQSGKCPIGLLYRSVPDGLVLIGITVEQQAFYGFDRTRGKPKEDARLCAAWRREIIKRRIHLKRR